MAQQTVTLTSLEKKSGNSKKGSWFFYLFQDAGGNRWQTKFNDSAGKRLAEAIEESNNRLNVELTYHEEDNNGFTNNVIDSFESLGRASEDEVKTQEAAKGVTGAEKDARISRAASLKAAVNTIIGLQDPNADVSDVIELSERYYDYIVNGAPVYAEPL